MDFMIKAVTCFVIFIFSWLYQEQQYQWDLTHQTLKDTNNLAVHDAIVMPDRAAMSEGRIIFDESDAREHFETTLRINLGLDLNFNPIAGSPMRHGVEIVEFEVFDDSNTIFPYLYDNPTYRVTKYLRGPAAFAVIRTKYPTLINRLGTGSDIQVPAIQEYKLDR